mgnify:CR=1 FL=1
MTTKEFLNQAYRIDQRINSKLEQIISLHALATKATSTLSDMPVSKTESQSKMAEIIAKIVDLEAEINRDIEKLMEIKQNIVSTIKKVQNPELQTLLELRYLCFRTWEQVALEMDYSIQHIFRIHDKALKSVKIFKT